jgi:hypothetical protein
VDLELVNIFLLSNERINGLTIVQVRNRFDSIDLELHIYKLNLGIYLQSSPQLSFNNIGQMKPGYPQPQ